MFPSVRQHPHGWLFGVGTVDVQLSLLLRCQPRERILDDLSPCSVRPGQLLHLGLVLQLDANQLLLQLLSRQLALRIDNPSVFQ